MPANERGHTLQGALHIARVAGGTALAFAMAAFLALLLVEPRTEVAARLDLPAASAQEGAEIAQGVNSPRFRARLAAAAPSAAPVQTPHALVRGWGERPELYAQYDAARGELLLSATAPDEETARALAQAAARLLAGTPDRPAEEASTSERIEELRDALARLPGVDPQQARRRDARLDELDEAARALDADLNTARERVVALEAEDWTPLSVEGGALQGAIEERAALAEAAQALRETLPADNPRRSLVERRLAALEATIDEARIARLGDAKGEADALQAQRAAVEDESEELAADAAAESATLAQRAEIEAELNRAAEDVRRSAGEAADPRLEILSVTQQRPPFLTVTALAGLAGLLAGLAACLLSRLVARRFLPSEAPIPAPQQDAAPEPAAPKGRGPATVLPLPAPVEGDAPVTLAEVASVLESFPVSRILVASVGGRGEVPAGLQLARRLADAGTLVLLADLSLGQGSARAAGVPHGLPGLREAAEEGLALSSVTLTDEGSGADILTGGRDGGASVPRKGGAILTFARRAYDHVIVDCGCQPADSVLRLVDPDCAVLLAPQGGAESEVKARQREFAASGLANLIVLEDDPVSLSASARSPSSGSGTWPAPPRGSR